MKRPTEKEIRLEALLGIAALLMLIGSLAPWESIGAVNSNAMGSWHGKAAFVGSLLALFATTVSYGIYQEDVLQKYKPYTDGCIGGLGSIVALIGGFAFFAATSPGASPTWGLYLTLAGGFLGLFSSYKLYQKGMPSIPRGLAGGEASL